MTKQYIRKLCKHNQCNFSNLGLKSCCEKVNKSSDMKTCSNCNYTNFFIELEKLSNIMEKKEKLSFAIVIWKWYLPNISSKDQGLH